MRFSSVTALQGSPWCWLISCFSTDSLPIGQGDSCWSSSLKASCTDPAIGSPLESLWKSISQPRGRAGEVFLFFGGERMEDAGGILQQWGQENLFQRNVQQRGQRRWHCEMILRTEAGYCCCCRRHVCMEVGATEKKKSTFLFQTDLGQWDPDAGRGKLRGWGGYFWDLRFKVCLCQIQIGTLLYRVVGWGEREKEREEHILKHPVDLSWLILSLQPRQPFSFRCLLARGGGAFQGFLLLILV